MENQKKSVELTPDEANYLALFLHSFNKRPNDDYWYSEKVFTKTELDDYQNTVIKILKAVPYEN